jgi:hypothetical protein
MESGTKRIQQQERRIEIQIQLLVLKGRDHLRPGSNWKYRIKMDVKNCV